MKAHLVDSERAARTYSYQNEKEQAELDEAFPIPSYTIDLVAKYILS